MINGAIFARCCIAPPKSDVPVENAMTIGATASTKSKAFITYFIPIITYYIKKSDI